VVVSGERGALDGLLAELLEGGVRAREIPVGYASHSAEIEGIREELLEGCAGVVPMSGGVPFYSTVLGGLVDTALLDGEYWYRNLRETVRFAQVTRLLLDEGYRAFVEVSPHPVLTVGVGESVDGVVGGSDEDVAVVGSLRREQGGLGRFLCSLGEAWVGGVRVDWGRVFAGSAAMRVELPTYAFQRERYWLERPTLGAGSGDVASLGQASASHPLLGAAVELADGEGWLFTGRLSLETYPWLADHVAMGVVLFPAAAFVELALHAGSETGCDFLEELTLQAPLVLPERGGVQVQISLGEPDEAGRRSVAINSRLEPVSKDRFWEEQKTWTCHAAGVLTSSEIAPKEQAALEQEAASLFIAVWPPTGAQSIPIDGVNERLAEQDYDYGPAFQGLHAMWRRGKDLFVEVALPEDQQRQADKFGLHPALLDAALHATLANSLGKGEGEGGEEGAGGRDVGRTSEDEGEGEGLSARGAERVRLVSSWDGVSLRMAGVSRLRVWISPTGANAISMVAADEDGALVTSMRSLALGTCSARELDGAGEGRRESLFGIEWTSPPPALSAKGSMGGWAALCAEGSSLASEIERAQIGAAVYASLDRLGDALDAGAPMPAAVLVDCATEDAGGVSERHEVAAGAMSKTAHSVTQKVLEIAQAWLADERFSTSRLVLVTRGAVAVHAEDGVPALAQAPAWGLLRSAQTEHPGRFVLVDVDGDPASLRVLDVALSTDEPQLAVRRGEVLVSRLAPMSVPLVQRASAGEDARTVDWRGTVLITGGTGGLGALVARHLASEHGVSSLLLVSRRGSEAEGAPELQRELESLGASVRVAACDVSDRGQIESLLGLVPSEHPLCAVVHTAGILEDGVIQSLTAEHVDRVLAPKVDAAWHLHELTAHLDLSAFILFSSAASTFGAAGQGNYAAANAFLDALAAHRRAVGLAAVSLAWGLLEQTNGMTARLDEGDRARIARLGIGPLSTQQGLELFDAALSTDAALVLPMLLDAAALRSQARAGIVPALLRGLLRAPGRRVEHVSGRSFIRRLASMPVEERERVVLALVREEAAIVLGHTSAHAIEAQRAFKELGFDSLAAVELRNRLNAATGLRVPSTLVFDYPTPTILAKHLLNGFVGEEVDVASVDAELDRLELALSSIAADHTQRTRATERLRAFLSRLSDTGIEEHTESDLESVSDDDMFRLIDRELEAS
jgi:NAD(P)-dependent dehydrogenase (short-subunit alcohol dehydrogenase family)/acyl carrier protein